MAIYRKTNPVAIDKPIDRLQNSLYTKLGWTNYESYDRCYKNEKDGGIIPERYTSNGNYEPVYFNDNFSATSFFLIDDNSNVTDSNFSSNVSLIYQVKLADIFPAITHRADEELINTIAQLLNTNAQGFTLTNVVRGINNVYSGLNIDLPKKDDMGNYFVVKFELTTPYYLCQ